VAAAPVGGGAQKKGKQRMRSLFAALAALTLLTTAAFADAVPQLVNYQGKVYQPSGAVVPDGAYKMAFSIYDVPTGGTAIWTETYDALQVKGSAFHVLLGSVNPIGASIFGSAERFLGVKLASDPELSPRQKVASVPYAMVAEKAASAATAAEATHAASADVAQTVPDGAITTEKIAPHTLSNLWTKTVAGQIAFNENYVDHPIPDASFDVDTSGGNLLILGAIGSFQPVGGTGVSRRIAVNVDGTIAAYTWTTQQGDGTYRHMQVPLSALVSGLAPGNHTIQLVAMNSGGTLPVTWGFEGSIQCIELKR